MSRIGPCVGPDQAYQNEIACFLRGRSIARECAADMGQRLEAVGGLRGFTAKDRRHYMNLLESVHYRQARVGVQADELRARTAKRVD